jgi:signal transduction histidine kinase/CHASE3 domain sensor protein/ActR/RegA family two-component response regulator
MILANSFISYHHLSRLRQISEQINATNQTMLALEQTLSLVKDVETGGRGYVLTGDRAYLTPYLRATQGLDEQLQFIELRGELPGQQETALRGLRKLVSETIAFIGQAVQMRDAEGAEAATTLISRAAGKHQMDRMRQLAADIRQALDARQQSYVEQAQQSFETALATFIVATASAVALMIVVFVLIRREIVDGQKHAEELRRYAQDSQNQRKWLETVMNLLPMPMLLVNTHRSRVIFANRAAESLAGGSFPLATEEGASPQSYATDLLGTPIPPDQMPLARVARGESLSSFELEWHLPSGSKSLLINADRLPAMFGHEAVSAVLFQDITRLKQIEAELRRMNRSKDALLAMLGHELRNPLAAITSAAELLRLQPPGDPLYEQAQEILERHIRHLGRLINEMLDYSRISSGKFRLDVETLDLADVLRNAAQTVQPQIEARQHHLTMQLPREQAFVCGDAPRLEQVFVNLLVNAAKYTDPGGRIQVNLETTARDAVVRVRDSGVGIAPEMLPKVFEMFEQLNPSLDRAEGGLGIGLNVVKSLVELHGGSVEAHSAGLGRGAEFVIRLPMATSTEPCGEEHAQMPTVATPERPARVIIVEDNRDIARVMAALVKRCGHEAFVAYDGPSALELARKHHPDVALLDIGLPGMSGHDLARRLRSDRELSRIRLVALTGYGQEEDRRRSREAGFDEHLTMPVSLATLQDVLVQKRNGDEPS